MKNTITYIATMCLAVVMFATPSDIYAQARRSSSSSSSASRSSSPSSGRSSSSPGRSSYSAPSRSTTYQAPSRSESHSSVNRSTGYSSQSRSSSVTRTAPQTRNSTATRPAAQTRNSTATRPAAQTRQPASSSARVTPSRPAGSSSGTRQSSTAVRSGSASPSRPAARSNSAIQSRQSYRTNSVNGTHSATNRTSGMHPASRPSQRTFASHNAHMHPHHRDFIPYDRPGRFFGAGPHYFGYRIHTLPPHYRRLHYWGRTYFFYNDIYYRPFGDYYVVCRPPFGVYYHPSLLDVALCAVEFAYYYDIYRDSRIVNSNWKTIEEQNKIIAQNNAVIASQNEAIQSRSQLSSQSYELASSLGLAQRYADASTKYYYEDGVFFVMDATGQYKVIVPPAGAIVDKLPEDYEEVVLNGNTYYKVDDTVYRMIMVEGSAKFEVLGQFIDN